MSRPMRWGDFKERIGPAVPLRAVPAILGVSSDQVRGLVRSRRLPIHSFHVRGRATHRLVALADLRRLAGHTDSNEPKLTIDGLRFAMSMMLDSEG